MVIIVINAAKASSISLRSIFLTLSIIRTPTITRAPLVAALGIIKNTGLRNRLNRNKSPVTNDVTPDRPPSAIPLALSIYVVMVDVPRSAPHVVPIASLIIASEA